MAHGLAPRLVGVLLLLQAAVASNRIMAQVAIFGDGFESGDTAFWGPCDPDGTFDLATPSQISYSCCLGLVDVTITQFVLANNAASVTSAPSNPATLNGPGGFCPGGSFTASAVLSGGCSVTYGIEGEFTTTATWQGSYNLTFVGIPCSCSGLGTPCVNQTFPLEAVR